MKKGLRADRRECFLLQDLCGFEDLFGGHPHPVIFSQHPPTHCARRIEEELSRPRDVIAVLAGAFVHEVVTRDCFALLIRKQLKRVAGLLRKLARLRRCIYADGDGTDPGFVEGSDVPLNAPQLGVTDNSPVAAIENKQHAFRRFVVDRL